MKYCSVENCEVVYYARGWCRKHYLRWQAHGDPLKLIKNSGSGYKDIGANDEEFARVVNENISYAGMLRTFGLKPSGGNYKILKMRIAKNKLDVSHVTGKAHGTSSAKRARTIEEALVKNSTACNSTVRRLLVKTLGWQERCVECGIENEWNGRPIILHLDHINGDNTNNEPGNLRFLCPNCHSQTSTYCVGHKRNRRGLVVETD